MALILGVAKQSGAQTIDTDKAALLAFKASVIDAGRLLSSWTEDTDPCVDDWAGIKCNCFPFFEDTTSAERPQVKLFYFACFPRQLTFTNFATYPKCRYAPLR